MAVRLALKLDAVVASWPAGCGGGYPFGSAPLIDRLQNERSGHRAGIVAEHQRPLRLDRPHNKELYGTNQGLGALVEGDALAKEV